MGKPSEQGTWMDALASFEAGMDSNKPPVALPKNQLAYATNATLRGTFVTHRPPYQSITLGFTNAQVQASFEEALWQGACYYKPDFGAEQIVCSIGGRFFTVTPAGTGASVADITPADDANPAENSQAWLWQSEPFVVINDGQSTPAIYNGTSVDRANQGETVATVLTGGTFPQEGASLAVTFTAPYEGPQNTPLYCYNSGNHLLGTVEVNTTSSTSGYYARLTNIGDTPGTVHPSGAALEIINSWSGTSSPAFTIIKTTPNNIRDIIVTPVFTPPVNSILRWPGVLTAGAGSSPLECVVVAIVTPGPSSTGIRIQQNNGSSAFYVSVPNNAACTRINAPPDVVLAHTTQDFTAPAVGQYVDVTVDTYLNLDGQVVTINGAKYSVSVVPPVTLTTLYIKTISNLTSPSATVDAGATLRTIPQLPVGRMGVYGMGRNWVCLADGQSYLASDIVGSSTGSIAYNFRDSVLFVTENNYLAGGGVFRIPAAGQQITSMRFPATLDSSLGQGPLQILTPNITFSCNAPIQRSDWQDLVNPIQTQSLVGGGSVGDSVAINGDLWFRALDGIRSLKLARQDFFTYYGNTPQSTEMNRVILSDNRNLLNFWHGVVFDNRGLFVASPEQSTAGVIHTKLIALNLDPNSSLRQKDPAIYDGEWNGLNILKIVTGQFAGVDRCFAFTYDTDTAKIGLTEILPTAEGNSFDNGDEKIQWSFESPALFYQPDARQRQLMRLNDGEIIVKDISGSVRFDVYYRPDYSDTWTTWHSWETAATPPYQPRMGLGQPKLKLGDSATGRPYAVGYHFQVKVIVTGHCTVMGMNLFVVSQSETAFVKPMPGLTPIE